VLKETVKGIEMLLGIKQVTSTTESLFGSFQKSKLKAGFSHTMFMYNARLIDSLHHSA
jgi:hypothetical protein